MSSYFFIIVLIILSAMFSGSEIAFASSSKTKLKKDKTKIGEITKYIFDNYDKALISILIGNNLVNIASSSIATLIVVSLVGNNGVLIATIVMTIIIVIFGEIAPKIIASKIPEDFSKLIAIPLRIIMYITSPIVYLTNLMIKKLSKIWEKSINDEEVTASDLETIIDTVEEEGVIDEDTANLLQNALDFDDVLAYEVITHRLDVEGLDIEDKQKKNIDIIMNTSYSRLPVYKENFDNIIGYIIVDECLKHIVLDNFKLKEMIHEPLFIHKTTKLDDVLITMRENDCHLAIVVDEYGGSMGIITMEDVLEEIVGDIWDEKDTIDEEFEKINRNTFDILGEMRLEELFEKFELDYDNYDTDNATVGGWAIEMLGHYPKVGDKFKYKNYSFEITKIDDLRVLELRAKKRRTKKSAV